MHFQEKSEFQELIAKAQKYHTMELPFVLYRKPNEKTVQGVFQKEKGLHQTVDLRASGFVFAPFEHSEKNVLIKPDATLVSPWSPLQSIPLIKGLPPTDNGKKKHLHLVDNALKAIKNGRFKKVVASRKITMATQSDAFTIFCKAVDTYANAFCYLWYHPKVGMWLGATPERLVEVTGQRLHTTALAGTLPYQKGQLPNWSNKEIEEQQMVTDFLCSQLKNHLTHIKVSETTAVKAGNLWHLKTDISGALTKPRTLASIIANIHPTSAVCGEPKAAAQDFIVREEGYDREFYTGFLGELNLNENTKLFVNLRCIQLKGSSVTIYVGGGITRESNPLNEWLETQNKSKTMLTLL